MGKVARALFAVVSLTFSMAEVRVAVIISSTKRLCGEVVGRVSSTSTA